MKTNLTNESNGTENQHSIYEVETEQEEFDSENTVKKTNQVLSSYNQILKGKSAKYIRQITSFFVKEQKHFKLFIYALGVFTFYLLYSILQERIV